MKNKRLKIARIENDMSQDDLANPSLKLCIAICKTLGKTLNDLFWEEEL